MVTISEKVNDDVTIKHVKDKFTLLKQIMELIPADQVCRSGKKWN